MFARVCGTHRRNRVCSTHWCVESASIGEISASLLESFGSLWSHFVFVQFLRSLYQSLCGVWRFFGVSLESLLSLR